MSTQATIGFEQDARPVESDDGLPVESRWRRRFLGAIPLLLALAGVACWLLSLASIHPYRVGAIGLVAQLSALWWLGLALVTGSVVSELRRLRPRTVTMMAGLLALAIILHGTLPATESAPRFSTAYYVAGFSDYIGRTGHALPRLDVRMSWPAMFAAAGMAARAMGVSTLWFLRWCPLVLNLVYLVPLKALANTCLRTPRARWAALAIFLAGNWIDQDYFSPQGLNLLLFLAAAAIVVRVFAVGGFSPRLVRSFMETGPWQGLSRTSLRLFKLPHGAVRGEEPELGTVPSYRVAMWLVLLGILVASAVSHQITPAALCLVFFGLMVTGRTSLRMVWLLLAVLVWAWLSWEGHAYWSNHLSKLFGSAGQVGSTFNSTVSARLQGSSLGRELVQRSRLLAAAIIWVGGMAGFWALWRRGRTLISVAIVAVAPIAVAGAVSYGGEVALRILLFGLAPASLLIASLIDQTPLRGRAVAICLTVSLAILVLFPIARYGNESFEAIAPGDLDAATWIHSHVPSGAQIYVANRDEPLYYAHVGAYRLIEVGGLVSLRGNALASHLPVTRLPTYVYLTRSENNYGIDFLGNPPGWVSQFIGRLLATGYVHVVYANASSHVLRIEKHPRPKPVKPNLHPHLKPAVAPTPRPKPVFHPKPKPIIQPKPKPKPLPKPLPTPTTRPPATSTTLVPSTTSTTGPVTTSPVPTSTSTVP